MQKAFFLSFLILLSVILFGQNSSGQITNNGFKFERWTTEDGLPQNSVNDIIQSNDGYLWLATYGGVAKFDGLNFQKINLPQLADQRVICLYEDAQNNIWIGTEDNGVFRYSADTTIHYGQEQSWGKAGVAKVFENDIGELVASVYSQGLFRLTKNGFQKIEHESFFQNTIHSIYKEKDYFLLSSEKGVIQYSSRGVILLKAKGLQKTNSGSKSFSLKSIFKESDGTLRLSTSGYVYSWSIKNQEIELDESYGTTTRFLHHLITSDGNHWMGTLNSGVFVRSKFGVITSVFADQLKNSGITCLFEDNEGNIWVGSTGDGLSRISKNTFSSIGLESGLAQDVMLGLYEDENQLLWLGTHSKGVHVLKNGKVVRRFLENRGIWSIVGNGKRKVWVGLYGSEGLVEYDFTGNEIKESFVPEYYDNAILALKYDTLNSRLLVAAESGFSSFANGEVLTFPLSNFTQDLRPRAIEIDKNQNIWLGTRGNGLFKIDGELITQYTEEDGLANNKVRTVYADGSNNIWIGTYGGGLSLFKDEKFRTIDESNGLYNNVISAIEEDEYGTFWMSCNKGIFSLKKAQALDFFDEKVSSVTCNSYTAANGMGSSEANGGFQPSSCKLQSGELLFPTMKGITNVNPSEINETPLSGKVVFEKVVVDNVELKVKNGTCKVPPGAKSIEIQYTHPTFTNPELLQFQVKMQGFQTEWSNVKNRRIAYFSSLAPKEYLFQVKSAGSNGIWSATPSVLKIIVAPFFYQTSLFRWVVGISLILLISSIFIIRNRQAKVREQELKIQVTERTKDLQQEKELTEKALKQVEKQSLELEKMGKAKSNFFANVSHELKTPLTLIKGPVEALLEDESRKLENDVRNDLELVQSQSAQLSHLITQLLDIARSEDGKWATIFQVFDAKKLIEKLIQDYTQGFAQKEIQLSFICAEDSCLMESDSDIVYKIVSNLLSNALKFTPQFGSVEVSLSQQNGQVCLSVIDSGEGINEEDLPFVFERFFKSSNQTQQNLKGSGIGLALVKQFVEILEGEIKAENTEEKGAKFLLKLPIGDISKEVEVLKSELLSASLEASAEKPTEMVKKEENNDIPLILIVDDNEGIRQFISKNLSAEYRLEQARDGVEGLQMAIEHQPDLIISDIMMPRKDGLEMLSDLRQNETTSYIALLLLSAKGSEETRAKGWEYGADGYMAKPFNGKELKVRIKAILQNRIKLREKLLSDRLTLKPAISKEEDPFKIKFDTLIQESLPNPDFSFTDNLQDFNMSLSTFTRTVKEKLQTTPQVYLREKRLFFAKELLQNSEETVAEIAYASGFNSVSYFNRIYKKHFGEKPSSRN